MKWVCTTADKRMNQMPSYFMITVLMTHKQQFCLRKSSSSDCAASCFSTKLKTCNLNVLRSTFSLNSLTFVPFGCTNQIKQVWSLIENSVGYGILKRKMAFFENEGRELLTKAVLIKGSYTSIITHSVHMQSYIECFNLNRYYWTNLLQGIGPITKALENLSKESANLGKSRSHLRRMNFVLQFMDSESNSSWRRWVGCHVRNITKKFLVFL